mmetsp:Transcript_13876/g.40493  ORF Transcript_13876/g.40493 Transcript_13876/m.40493 type:complete len:203 (+) Transcript_13876:2618-3226(+)
MLQARQTAEGIPSLAQRICACCAGTCSSNSCWPGGCGPIRQRLSHNGGGASNSARHLCPCWRRRCLCGGHKFGLRWRCRLVAGGGRRGARRTRSSPEGRRSADAHELGAVHGCWRAVLQNTLQGNKLLLLCSRYEFHCHRKFPPGQAVQLLPVGQIPDALQDVPWQLRLGQKIECGLALQCLTMRASSLFPQKHVVLALHLA